jgi:hypothetical protein
VASADAADDGAGGEDGRPLSASGASLRAGESIVLVCTAALCLWGCVSQGKRRPVFRIGCKRANRPARSGSFLTTDPQAQAQTTVRKRTEAHRRIGAPCALCRCSGAPPLCPSVPGCGVDPPLLRCLFSVSACLSASGPDGSRSTGHRRGRTKKQALREHRDAERSTTQWRVHTATLDRPEPVCARRRWLRC